ncbi:hypothetical protein BD289DRAFT_438648 [Coniella lustricola]|uniref:Ysc84 actin-binding domain-containing protein n=1 Tax=Coniella lustricola TaxID=2025994 RepID=A0A2T3A2R8_9PEZI|nr:hypothetical protein BD289DRAFT_438648 [Coniella lustricola]
MAASEYPEHQNPAHHGETVSRGNTAPPYQEYVNQYPPPASTYDAGTTQEHPPPMPPRPQQQQHDYASAPSHQQPGVVAGGSGGVTHDESNMNSNTSSKPTVRERLFHWSTKVGVPINKLTNKLGSEAWWPSTLDIESDKAARILQSFTKDGFYIKDTASKDSSSFSSSSPQTPQPPQTPSTNTSTSTSPQGGPKQKPKVLVKIPQKAIESAAGLAIFTTFRTGLHISGAGGSGVLVARLPDGSWSPPSGFLVHTLGAGFMIGLDIYDCVCILRTPEAVAAFTRPRLSLGGEIGLVAGPVGAGKAVDAAVAQSTKPVWGYVKSRGLYAGVQADGTVIISRPDANAAFYGLKGIKVNDILQGKVPTQGQDAMWPQGGRHLMEVLKSAEGKANVDQALLKEIHDEPTPGDFGIGDPGHKA